MTIPEQDQTATASVSIRGKVTAVLLLVCTVSLVTAGALQFVLHRAQEREHLAKDMVFTAHGVGQNCISSLEFDDREFAVEVLETLRTDPALKCAAIYDDAGDLFATFECNGADCWIPPRVASASEPELEGSDASVVTAIESDGEVLGYVYLNVDQVQVRERVREGIQTTAFAALVALILAWLLSARLREVIIGPILALAATAQRVTTERTSAYAPGSGVTTRSVD